MLPSDCFSKIMHSIEEAVQKQTPLLPLRVDTQLKEVPAEERDALISRLTQQILATPSVEEDPPPLRHAIITLKFLGEMREVPGEAVCDMAATCVRVAEHLGVGQRFAHTKMEIEYLRALTRAEISPARGSERTGSAHSTNSGESSEAFKRPGTPAAKKSEGTRSTLSISSGEQPARPSTPVTPEGGNGETLGLMDLSAAADQSSAPVTAIVKSPSDFVDILLGELGKVDCLVLGDGTHSDLGLTRVLAEPHLPERLASVGVTHIVLEHIYPSHLEQLRLKDTEIVKAAIKKSLTEKTFQPSSFQNTQAITYTDFVVTCFNERKLHIIAADDPWTYREGKSERIRHLNRKVTALVTGTVRDQEAKPKVLVVIGAAHTNRLNSLAAAPPFAQGETYDVPGVVEKLQSVTELKDKVGEYIVLADETIDFRNKVGSLKSRTVYAITDPHSSGGAAAASPHPEASRVPPDPS